MQLTKLTVVFAAQVLSGSEKGDVTVSSNGHTYVSMTQCDFYPAPSKNLVWLNGFDPRNDVDLVLCDVRIEMGCMNVVTVILLFICGYAPSGILILRVLYSYA